MKILVRSLLAVLVIMLLQACNFKEVGLQRTNATGEVQPLSNLEFEFTKSLLPDSLLMQQQLQGWDSTEYITFSPEIPGRFRWAYGDKLVFSPAEPLKPATTYTARLNKELLRNTSYNTFAKSEITFHTPALQLENSNVMWTGNGSDASTAQPQIDLDFNYPVDPSTLKDHLQIGFGQQGKDYSITTLNKSSHVSIKLQGFRADDKDYTGNAVITKGMVPQGGKNPTEEPIDESLLVTSPYKITINDAITDMDGSAGTIHIKTSQEVVPSSLAGAVEIMPAVAFTTEATDEGFDIHSDAFDATKSYDITINRNIRGKIGGVLPDVYNSNVGFGKLEPQVSFINAKGVYLSSQGNKNIEIRISNLDKVKLVVSRIYENNLLAAERYGYEPKDQNENDYEEGEADYSSDYYQASYRNQMEFGDVIMEKEIDTRTLPRLGNNRVLHFDIEDKLPAFKGIYHIRVSSPKDYWVADSRFVSLSDIGVIAREGKDKMLVFTNSIKSAQPQEGVGITVYGNNNQLLGSGTTDKDGVAEVTIIRNELANFKPAMIIAKTATDFNYLPFATTKVATSRFDVGGRRSNSTGLEAFIYGERDIYRPGETMHAAVIVRDRQWQPIADVPVKLKFVLPNGKELATLRKTLTAEGAAEADVPLPASAITGSYTLEVYTGNDVLLGSKNLHVEEFVPDRIKVAAKLDKPFLLPGGSTTLSINAQNFFGPPAANRNYQTEIQVAQKMFAPPAYNRYNFSLANQSEFFDKVERQGQTDASGNAAETYAVPDMYQNMGILQAKFFTTVFDETGRPVNRAQSVDIYTQDWFAGVADDGYGYYPLNQPIKFPMIALNKDAQPVNGQAVVKIIKHEYRTVLTKSGDYFRYESQKDDREIGSYNVAINGTSSSFPFTPVKPGDYELRVYRQGADNYVSKEFYSYGFYGNDGAAFQVNTEGHIDIEVDKAVYKVGETAKVLFKTPFNGRLLVTTEQDKVISHQYLEATNRSASMELKMNSDNLPNVYINATLIKPHQMSDMPLTVANGFKSVTVEEADRKIDVQITAQGKVRSHTHQQVSVKAAPGAMVTLAAVDNGILQVSDYKTPQPYDFFYAKRALEVNSYNIYPLLFPEIRGKMSSTGGDGYDLERRTNPIRNNRVKLVSYWSGLQQADGSGNATFNFDVPQFSGEIRLMAVAAKGERFGGKDQAMTVADPIVVSTALPRFISPGDTVTVPVTITNTTAKATTATAQLALAVPLQVIGNASQSVSLAPNAGAQAIFKLVAGAALQPSKVTVVVNGLGEKFTDETEITVRPATTLAKQSGSGFVQGGATQNLTLGNDAFLPGSARYSLVVSSSPALEFGRQLQALIEYPYGCTEQTISSAFPQLYFADLSQQMNAVKGSTASANANIAEAIRKIKMRQLYNGGITLWDAEGTENWWATVYALHFLYEAKRAGFDVDNSLLETTAGYTINKLKTRQLVNYYFKGDRQKMIAPKEIAYSLYVLAMMNRPQAAVMNYYKQNNNLLALDSRYLLGAAYALAGDKTSFKQLLPGSFSGETSVASTGGSFYSDVRDEAIALNCLITADPNNGQIPIMAKHVAEKLKTRRYLSTQENAFGFLAMGKLARAANNSSVTATVRINGKEVGKMTGEPLQLSGAALSSRSVQVTASGNGRLYYYWTAEGIGSQVKLGEEDNYIRVRKRFYDRSGSPISGTTFKQNDLIIVGVTLENAYSAAVQNIVVTDLLPAGFEIENPRTKDIPGMDWIKDAATPEALDVRDDRINFFTSLNTAGKQTFYYAVRAVSPGRYQMGPVSADAMYNGEYHSFSGAGVVKVVQ